MDAELYEVLDHVRDAPKDKKPVFVLYQDGEHWSTFYGGDPVEIAHGVMGALEKILERHLRGEET